MTWHTNNSTPSTYSVEQGAAFSLTSYLDTIQSELVKSKPIRETSCSPDNETGSCQASQYGMKSAHSTESPGKDSLTSCVGDFPARTLQSATQKPKDSAENEAGFGLKCSALYASLNQTLSSWRIAQCLFPEDLDESCLTFPQSGILVDTLLWEATKPALAQTEKGSGFTLQRPTASDSLRMKFKLSSLVRPHHPNGNLAEQLAQLGMKRLTPECAEILMRWPEGWSDLKPLETGKIQSWQQWHSQFSQKD